MTIIRKKHQGYKVSLVRLPSVNGADLRVNELFEPLPLVNRQDRRALAVLQRKRKKKEATCTSSFYSNSACLIARFSTKARALCGKLTRRTAPSS